jgi:SRSO17 transposase
LNLGELQSVQGQLVSFVEGFSDLLGRRDRRHWCGMYLSGLIAEGERKSVQPMAQRLPGGDEQSMQQFASQSPWPFEPIQARLGQMLFEKLGGKAGALILDDTSFPKKGTHSVGVAPQYCGALGKTANCQALVSWHFADAKVHFPVRGELYLPQSWTSLPHRLTKAGVPRRRHQFQEKWRLALDLLDRFREQLPHELILADAAYGECKAFLRSLEERGERYLVQIPSSISFWPANVKVRTKGRATGRPRRFPVILDPRQKPRQAGKWAALYDRDPRAWKRILVPLQERKTVEIAALRVRQVDSRYWRRPAGEGWLLIERHGEEFKYYFSNLPASASLEDMVRWAHLRWKVEQGYQQLKEELGLDHFEGRSWLGFHHHVTLCFLAYGFLQLLGLRKKEKKGIRALHCPPSAAGSTGSSRSISARIVKKPAPLDQLLSGIRRKT